MKVEVDMKFRLATISDLSQINIVYEGIVDKMNDEGILIWDDFYPFAYFNDDINNNRFYVLEDDGIIASAFALCDSNAGEPHVKWNNMQEKALYLDRFGVNVNYTKKGIGSLMLRNAIALAGEKYAKWLRLFVVDINEPAINLYIKNGFEKVEGCYDEIFDDITLHEFGFEIKTSI